MEQSQDIKELAIALSKAQLEIIGAKKDSQNPFFNSSYADLASVWLAIREPLSKNGLSVVQGNSLSNPGCIVVNTILLHSSGQWIKSSLLMTPVKMDPQGVGSCMSYARRYALAAIVGCPQIDDDGNLASSSSFRDQQPVSPASVSLQNYVRDEMKIKSLSAPVGANPISYNQTNQNSHAGAGNPKPYDSGARITEKQFKFLLPKRMEQFQWTLDQLSECMELLYGPNCPMGFFMVREMRMDQMDMALELLAMPYADAHAKVMAKMKSPPKEETPAPQFEIQDTVMSESDIPF